jgi:hypothetical protein
MIRKALLTILLLSLPLAACKRAEEPPPTPAPETGAATAPDASAPVGPISSRGEKVGEAPPMAGGAQEGTLQFDIPSSWRSEPPATNMRMAQASIPGSGGPGDLVVFYFGPGGGGGVEANIQRWIGQMDAPPGSNPKAETFEANGYKVTWIDVAGTLKPSNMGAGPTTEQPGSRLLGAVVEGPGGPWFFKATGPDATLSAERENFLKMLRSVRAK